MTFCGEASTWAKLSLVLLIIALGFHCGGYGSNYWMARNTVRDKPSYGIGLWRMTNCSSNTPCMDYDIPQNIGGTWHLKAVKSFESITLILIFVAMVCMIFYVGSQRARGIGMAILVLVIITIAAASSIVGMIIWIVKVSHMMDEHYPGWSMGLTVFACTLCITAGILLIPDLVENDYQDIRKVVGEFQNLPVTREEDTPQPNERMYEDDMKPVVEPQGPLAAPVYQYLNYDKRRKMDGF